MFMSSSGNDMTLLYYTANVIPEKFAVNVRNHLVETAKGKPIISVSQKPIDFGENICVGDIGHSVISVYLQILTGLRAAKTKYIACCEDDTIHSPEYFDLDPEGDTFLYNLRWNVMPSYFYYRRRRNGLCTLVAPRELMIKISEEKLKRYEEIKDPYVFAEPGRRSRSIGLSEVVVRGVVTTIPSLTFKHRNSLSGISISLQSDRRVESLPYWGKASDVWNRFYEN